MADRIAAGEIFVEVNDDTALGRLRKIEAEFDRAMHNIDRQEAEVRITGNLKDLQRKLKQAEAEVKAHNSKIKELEKQRDGLSGSDKGKVTREINQRKELVKQIEREVEGLDKVNKAESDRLDTLKRTNKEQDAALKREKAAIDRERKRVAESRRASKEDIDFLREKAKAAEDYRRLQERTTRQAQQDSDRAHNAEQRRIKGETDALRERFKQAEKWREVQRDTPVRMAAERAEVLRLQREYAKLTDRIEGLHKKTAFTRETRAKVDLDTHDAYAKMAVVKAMLNRLGAHPPAKIRIDTDRSDVGRVKRTLLGLRDTATRGLGKGLEKIGGLGDVRILGNSLRTIMGVLAVLGPSLVGLMGSATALVGVLGTGLTGAAGVAGGALSGLAINLLGVKESLNPLVKDFKLNTQLVDAYHKALLKFGPGAKETGKAQNAMNHALKTMDPNARAAAKTVGALGASWQKLTAAQANKSFIQTVTQYGRTMKALQPTLAKNSNESMRLLGNSLSDILRRLRTPAAVKIFDSLGKSANQFLAPTLDALEHLGAAGGRVLETFARLFAGRAGQSFLQWAEGIDKASQNSDNLDSAVKRLGKHAADLGRFFMETGRLIKNVLNDSANAGDGLLNSMTKTEKRWNKFLTSDPGKNKMNDFFQTSVDNTKALYNALAPLIHAFVTWATGMAPFITAATNVFTWVSKLVNAFTHLIGLGGSVSTFAATLGTLWAVGKIGSFLSMIGRVIGAMKELGAVSSIKGILTGSFGARAAAAGVPLKGVRPDLAAEETAATAGAAKYGTAIESASVAGAAEFAAAIEGASTAGATENAAANAISPGGVHLPRGAKGAIAGEGVAAAETAAVAESAGAAEGAVGGLGAALSSLPFVAVAGGAVLLGAALYGLSQKGSIAKEIFGAYDKLQGKAEQGMARTNTRFMAARDSMDQFGQSLQQGNLNLKEARDRLAHAKKGTDEYKQAQLDVRSALREHIKDQIGLTTATQQYTRAAEQDSKNANQARDAHKAKLAILQDEAKKGGVAGAAARTQLDAEIKKQQQLDAAAQAAANRVAVAPIAAARAMRGMIALTGEAEQSLGKLARIAGGKKIATTIGLKYEDPRKAGKVGNAARSALQSGVGKGAILRIIADSRSADQAIRRLTATHLPTKRLLILESGGAHAVKALEAIIGRKLTKKEQKIAEAGGAGVIRLLEKILGIRLPKKTLDTAISGVGAVIAGLNSIIKKGIPNKHFNVSATGIGAALSGVNSIVSAISRVNSKSVTITTTHRNLSVKGGYAGRIIEAAQAGQDLVGRALTAASTRQPKITRGGRYHEPTLLVGEERRREYVIATNPAYRANNKRYVKEAAEEFGMTVVDAAATGVSAARHKKKKHKAKPSKAYGHHYTQHHGIGPHRGAKNPLPVVTNDSLSSDYIPEHYQQTTTTLAATERAINGYDKQLRSLDEQYYNSTKGPRGNRSRKAIARKIEQAKKLRKGEMKKLADEKKKQTQARKWYERYTKDKNNIETWTTQMNTAATNYNNTTDPEKEKTYMGTWTTLKGKRKDEYTDLVHLLKWVRKHSPKRYWASLDSEIAGAVDDRTTGDFEAAPPGPEAAAVPTFEDFIKSQNFAGTLSDDAAAIARAAADTPDDPSDDKTAKEKLRDDYKTLYDAAVRLKEPSDIITDAANAYVSARDDANPASSGSGSTSDAAQGVIYSGAVQDSLRADVLRDFGSNSSPYAGTGLGTGIGFGASWTQQNPAALNPAVNNLGTSPSVSTAQPGDGGGVTKVINQTNNFQQPPADAHTFSQGVAFELGAAI